jgi:hypothetical protein
MIRSKITAVTILSVLAMLSVAFSPMSAVGQGMVFIEVDVLTKECEAGSSVGYQRFVEEGIEIPFPQRTVYIKEMPKLGK